MLRKERKSERGCVAVAVKPKRRDAEGGEEERCRVCAAAVLLLLLLKSFCCEAVSELAQARSGSAARRAPAE